MQSDEHQQHRKIRSYVKRQGRITLGQDRALNEFLPVFGIDHLPGILNFDELFSRQADTVLEIGFGMGQSLLQQAIENPALNYLGIEVHRPGVGALLNGMQESALDNIRVSLEDAVDVLDKKISDQSLAGVQLFFPDPWHKNKHHKRRLVQHSFLETIKARLKPGGFFHLATDWENYAEHMLNVFSTADGYKNISLDGNYIDRPESRPLTKFEQRGERLGHGVWDLMFIRN